MNSHRTAISRVAAHKRSPQDGGAVMVEFEEICIINIENMDRELSPYQKCRLVEEVRKG